MTNDITAMRERCDQLHELIRHCEADGAALHLALQEAWDHIRLGTQPDDRTARRWDDALAPFVGSPLLAELNLARRVCDRLLLYIERGAACPLCGFGRTLDGAAFHGRDCALAAYAIVRASAEATTTPEDAERQAIHAAQIAARLGELFSGEGDADA